MEQFAFQHPPKTNNEGALCVDDDKLFQTRGPATQNARSPMVVRRTLGMSSLAECRGRGSQPSAWLQGCHRLQLVSKVWRSSTMETTKKRAPQVWTDCAQGQTTSAVPWAVALCARTSVWSRSAEQRHAKQTEVAPSTVHSSQTSQCCIAIEYPWPVDLTVKKVIYLALVPQPLSKYRTVKKK